MIHWGATLDEWKAWARLTPKHIFPVVADPAQITGDGDLAGARGFGKRPSYINRNGEAVGIAWANAVVTPAQIMYWSGRPEHGIGARCIDFQVLDLDIDDEAIAERAAAIVDEVLAPHVLPLRTRQESPRMAMLFRTTDTVGKRWLQITPSSRFEILMRRQFVVLAGRHKSGQRIEWPGGIPASLDEIPVIDAARMRELEEALCDGLEQPGTVLSWSTDSMQTATAERMKRQIVTDDPLYQFVKNSSWLRAEMPNGALAVHCPFCRENAALGKGPASADGLDKTLFFPRGLGEVGYGGFKCMHTNHGPKTVIEFMEAIGYRQPPDPTMFEQHGLGATPVAGVTEDGHAVMTPASVHLPPLPERTQSGNIITTHQNVLAFVARPDLIGFEIRRDVFKQVTLIKDTHYTSVGQPEYNVFVPLRDVHYPILAVRLNTLGLRTVGDTMLRGVVDMCAEINSFDSAIEWLRKLHWDGRPRIANFCERVFSIDDEYQDYARAISLYMWTALAGRVSTPGVKADMAPIFIGLQGARKTTFVSSLVPYPDWFGTIDLAASDDDLARRMRGKVVAELTEMRGMGKRDRESLKGWMSQQTDEWVPKYREHAVQIKRRFVAIGTGNRKRITDDPTGSRRMLPITVGSQADIEWIKENLENLWAEAKHMYYSNGVMWQQAEALGRKFAHRFAKPEGWEQPIRAWMERNNDSPHTITEIALSAIGLSTAQISRNVTDRIEDTLIRLEAIEHEDGRWTLT